MVNLAEWTYNSSKEGVYSKPGANGYQMRVDYAAGERAPVVLDGVEVGSIAVDDMLP